MFKLDCYVDETGQDTCGELFVVGVVVPLIEREDCRAILQGVERQSGRGPRKWAKSTMTQRIKWLDLIAVHDEFRLFFSHYSNTREYVKATIRTTADALSLASPTEPYRVTVFVDGFSKAEAKTMGAALHRRSLPVKKVRGLNDRSDEMIRIADAVAGLARDFLEGSEYVRRFCEETLRRGLLTRLP